MIKVAALTLLIATTAAASDMTKVHLGMMTEVKTVKIDKINQDRVLLLLGKVTDAAVDPLVASIKEFAKNPKEPLYLVIDSVGGRLDAGQKLIDTIRGAKAVHGLKTTCIVTANALSMAAVIASYCHQTYLQPNAVMMFHEASYGIEGTATEVSIFVAFNDRWLQGFERRLAKQLGISYEDYVALRRDQLWITADEAVEAGFADAIIDNFYYEAQPPAENPFTLFFGQFLKGLTNGKAK